MPIENPFQDPLRFERQVPECIVVIFGANGDLTKRKLLPALYRLAYDRRLSTGFAVVGISRTPMSDEQFRQKMQEAVQQFSEDTQFDEDVWKAFAGGLSYVAGDIADPQLYRRLAAKLKEIEDSRRTGGNVMFYLSTQPSQYAPIAQGLGGAGLGKGGGWRRLVVEKPFGHDLESARELSDRLHESFDESSVYRIDHYLGKETVQNILAFRFGNGIFEPLWNRRYVNHVQITGAESIGVEDRATYYQEAGALDDMIQNHLLQVMATIAMEPSASFRANSVRDERSKLLRSIRAMTPEEILRNAVPGQYGPASIGGKALPGFRQEKGVDPQSQTNTYAAVTFFVENWRWAGVPFYVRTGKRLPKRVTEIAIQFNPAPLTIFDEDDGDRSPNLLIVRIQPDEGISLKFLSKRPGAGMNLRPVSMDFNYGSSFGERSPSAYETLLLDAIIGDATLYTRQDMVEASWSVIEPIQNVWRATHFDFPNYAAGTWGPAAADEMLARRGHAWRRP
ncbi:MAG: glucose-6-phosphate dehydrogenase [Candidatus Sulfopaludibacter sp.]|nr:glucose-6-phosphate dehydrogenase [Candidatus Sulfopaludibacter sp.]